MLTGRRRGWRLLSAVFLMPSIAHAAASFVVFDGKPGSPNDTLTYLYNISHDGKYVVGESVFHGGPHGEGGYADRTGAGWIVHRLGTLPSDEPPYGPAYDVAANASRIVGFANAGSPTLDVPTSFSPPGGPLTVLGMFPGDKVGEARGVNVNGSLLVGWGLTERTSRFGSADPYRHALLWSAPAFIPVLVDNAPGAPLETVAMAVTHNGNVIAGFGVTDASIKNPYDPARDNRGHQAMVWRLVPGAGSHHERVFLPFLNGLTACSRATDVDGAGQTVVGFSGIYGESRAVLWGLRHPSGNYEIADLGVLAGFEASGALGISQNGRVVVGSCYRVDGDNFESTAFLWDRRQGMRDVRKALLDAGVTGLEGWTLLEASAVSENGEWVCGTARNADWDIFGWVARMP